ncbi:MAG: DUF3320 domain-containing protein [Pirellulales bacterium]
MAVDSSNSLHAKLEKARRDLLDLTTRNRLLNTSRSSSRSSRLEVVDESSDEVFRILVQERKAMSFLPGKDREPDSSQLLLDQPDFDDEPNTVAARHVDAFLQTSLTSESLQHKLLRLYYDARTFQEEQGINILYLAMGFLKWFEDDKSDRERFAPLLLIPVQLDRKSAASKFHLKYTEDEISTNLSLAEKLKVDFGITLPEVPDVESIVPTNYFSQVKSAIEGRARWELLPNDMVLWFFSFSKFLMCRDLKPDVWPTERQITNHGLISSLLGEGFRDDSSMSASIDNIDQALQPIDMTHVTDADSSQTIAIHEVKQGRNLVVQGPPGTGKSQTITNFIATAVKDGKKVLFVAEKMAALEVVKRRLDNVGLGDMCLELHSHKANKRTVVEQLGNTLQLGRPRVENVDAQAEHLKSYRDKLNRHAEIMHTYLEPAKVTPFQALGELVRLRAAGVPPVDFQLEGPLTWTPTNLRERRNMLGDLVVHLNQIGSPKVHPWRGVQLSAVLPADVDRLAASLASIAASLERLSASVSELAKLLRTELPTTWGGMSLLVQLGGRLAKSPPMDRQAMANDVWGRRGPVISELVEKGQKLAETQQSLQPTFADIAWETDVSNARRDIAAHGRSWFRFLHRDYRQGMATFRGILIESPPRRLSVRLSLLDQLTAGQKLLRTISSTQANEIGSSAFGGKWQGTSSPWTELAAIVHWEADCRNAKLPPTFRKCLAEVTDLDAVHGLVQRIAPMFPPLKDQLRELFRSLQLDTKAAFGVDRLSELPVAQLQRRIAMWQQSPETITRWIAYFTRWQKLSSLGLGGLADRIDQGLIAGADVIDRFEMAYYEQLIRSAFDQYAELREFDGGSHELLIAKFRQLDLQRLQLARQEVAMSHFQGLPSSNGDLGEIGVIRREIKKKRAHLPLRRLLHQAGHAVQAVKPVFMMSPLSVAQYLEPGILEFDLLVIDEASQVKPVDALGAIARAKQVVVVGDDRQLPPTQFFNRVVGDDGDPSEADDAPAADLESVLGLCEAQGIPQRMLRWHYRSRHHSLIAVSNHKFYQDRLFVVPSPSDNAGSLGLRFHHVTDGQFDRGGSATNRVEARAVADAVMEHASKFPDKTLGVGAFSVAQRDAILDELESRRRARPDLESFFATAVAEPFFVKNLENIQGDERDVIFISVGYGKDSSGYMAMNFGPLNNDGGERRLNVLITRARERCEVFSSITAEDIDLNRTKAVGVQALKDFLTYAKTGFLDTAVASGREFDSQFEIEVARAIQGHGYQVDTQVGVAGFFVDLAIVDPGCPGRYLLGIECDGASYHSSRSARDRDRLRQQVLEDRGWTIHRIWSTDWFHRPEEQLRKVLARIEEAKSFQPSQREQDSGPIVCPERAVITSAVTRDNHTAHIASAECIASVPYQEASFTISDRRQIHEVPVGELANIVTRIVEIEGPVHQDEVARRVTTVWGSRRTGSRIAEAVERALAEATHQGEVVQAGLYFQSARQQTVPIRNRENVQSANLRKPEYLAPTEIQAAVLAVVNANCGVSATDVSTEVARLLGFKYTSAQMRQLVDDEISIAAENGLLEQRNGKLYASQSAVSATS